MRGFENRRLWWIGYGRSFFLTSLYVIVEPFLTLMVKPIELVAFYDADQFFGVGAIGSVACRF